jgi:hypothetical protein
MSYTSEDLRRDKEEYREWARQKDSEQITAYMNWLREHREYIKRSSQHESR